MRTTTRREFLKYSLAGAGLTVALAMTPYGLRLLTADEVKEKTTFMPNAWIQIAPDNRVTIVINKSEMGQGVATALPMIVADELEADWNQIRFLESPAEKQYVDPEMGQQLTGGSTSVRHMYKPLRVAGASVREMLVTAAAKQWTVPVGECQAVLGTVQHAKSGRSVTYGQLAQEAGKLPVPQNPRLKKENQFRYIGRPMARLDVPDKVRGKAVFGIDANVPGMLYASIARPPAFGAQPASYDATAARKVPGVVQVAKIDQGIAVIAKSITAAWKGRDALQAKWSPGTQPDLNNETLEQAFTAHLDTRGMVALDEGDVRKALAASAQKIDAIYVLPYLAHVTMEPMDCTADVRRDRCDIWVPTQNQSMVVKTAAKITGLPPERINVHTTYLGGGFGRRGETGYADEAVRISKAAGKPVKVIWTREEDVQHDVFRPGYCCRITGGVDQNGKLTSWSHTVVVQSIFERFAPQRMKNGIDPAAVEGIVDMDYEIPNLHVEWVKMDNPVPIGFWRSVGNSQNGFTTESFMDELAHAARKDPVEFRLNMLRNHVPATRLIETVAEKSGWGKPPKKGQARGLAYNVAYGTRVAEVAEVSVDERRGIIVHKVVCAVDCGPVVVNPAIIEAQATGAIVMGLSAALGERVDFEQGGVKSANFYNYHELRMSHAPEIEVHILRNQDSMGGIGEPPLPPIAPAVANAVFAATGKRIRQLPMLAQLQKA